MQSVDHKGLRRVKFDNEGLWELLAIQSNLNIRSLNITETSIQKRRFLYPPKSGGQILQLKIPYFEFKFKGTFSFHMSLILL
jgi:hypothetical protein